MNAYNLLTVPWRSFPKVISWLALALCAPAMFAADPPPATGEPLRVGVSPVFPPMVFKQGKELAGVEVDLARALGEHLGRKVVFVEVPWIDQVETFNDKRTDIIFLSDSTLAWYLAGMHGADGLSAVPIALSEEQLAWAMRKSDDALLASVNTFITQARQEGIFSKVFRRWTAIGD